VGGAAEWIAGLGLRWVLVQAGSDKEVIGGARFVFGAGVFVLEANPR
jgi:hypothetical protein